MQLHFVQFARRGPVRIDASCSRSRCGLRRGQIHRGLSRSGVDTARRVFSSFLGPSQKRASAADPRLWLSPATHRFTPASELCFSVRFRELLHGLTAWTPMAGGAVTAGSGAVCFRSAALRMPRWSKRCLNFSGSLPARNSQTKATRLLVPPPGNAFRGVANWAETEAKASAPSSTEAG